MLQFTQAPKRRGLFGSQGMGQGVMPGDQPGAMPSMGAPGQGYSAQPPADMGQPMQPANVGDLYAGAAPIPQHSKVNWGGIAADFLSGLAGQPGQYLASIHAEQQRAEQERQYQRRRTDENTDWQARETFKTEHPSPVNNDTVNDYGFISQHLGGEAGDQYLRRLADPDVTVPLPNGQMYIGPRSGMAAALGGAGNARPAPATKVIGGKTYYNVGGKWFDEPQGDGGAAAPGARPFSGNRLDNITMMSESSGNPNAISPAGARGLMQVMPGTERAPGFGIRPGNGTADDRNRVGREYRAKMQQRYGGDLRKMWAAYNWGPGNLEAAIAKHGENGWFAHAPQETRDYIARNLRAAGGS